MVPAGTDARWDELVSRCTERDRDARPASSREVADALAPFVHRAEKSVVVFPFRVAGEASRGEVIAGELESMPATIPKLRVVAASHGDRGVDAIVEGEVQIDGERVRITARLVEKATGTQLW